MLPNGEHIDEKVKSNTLNPKMDQFFNQKIFSWSRKPSLSFWFRLAFSDNGVNLYFNPHFGHFLVPFSNFTKNCLKNKAKILFECFPKLLNEITVVLSFSFPLALV